MTQIEQVAEHLNTHGSITSWDAFGLYHITRLASCIFVLRSQGMPIEKEMHYESRSRWAEYKLKMPLPVVETEERQEVGNNSSTSKYNMTFLGGQL